MNIDKAQLKVLIANDFGADLEDRLEGEQKTAYELGGGASALKQASTKVVRDLVAHVEKSFNDGEIKDGMDAPSVVQLIKKYLARVGDYLSHLSDVEMQKSIAQAGRVDGIRSAMKVIEKTRNDEIEKIKVFNTVASSSDADTDLRTIASFARAEHGTVSDRRQEQEKKLDEDIVSETSVSEEIHVKTSNGRKKKVPKKSNKQQQVQ